MPRRNKEFEEVEAFAEFRHKMAEAIERIGSVAVSEGIADTPEQHFTTAEPLSRPQFYDWEKQGLFAKPDRRLRRVK